MVAALLPASSSAVEVVEQQLSQVLVWARWQRGCSLCKRAPSPRRRPARRNSLRIFHCSDMNDNHSACCDWWPRNTEEDSGIMASGWWWRRRPGRRTRKGGSTDQDCETSLAGIDPAAEKRYQGRRRLCWHLDTQDRSCKTSTGRIADRSLATQIARLEQQVHPGLASGRASAAQWVHAGVYLGPRTAMPAAHRHRLDCARLPSKVCSSSRRYQP